MAINPKDEDFTKLLNRILVLADYLETATPKERKIMLKNLKIITKEALSLVELPSYL